MVTIYTTRFNFIKNFYVMPFEFSGVVALHDL